MLSLVKTATNTHHGPTGGRARPVVYPALHLMLYGSPLQFAAGQTMLAIPIGMALGFTGSSAGADVADA